MKLTKKRLMVVIGILVGIPVAAYLLSQFPKFSEGFDGEDKKEEDVDTEEGEEVMDEEPMEDDEEVVDEEMEEEPMEDDEEVVDEEMEEEPMEDDEDVDEEVEEDEPKPVEKDQFCFGSFCNVIDDEKEVTPEITMKTALE